VLAADADVVANCAAWTDVDACVTDEDRAMRVNGTGAGLVARAAHESGALMVQISTNEVFPGVYPHAYSESDRPDPINAYARSKLSGEQAVASEAERHLIIRTAWLYGDDQGFPARIRRAARHLEPGEPLGVVGDEWGNPTPVRRLAPAIVACVRHALADPTLRVLHLAGVPRATRYDWAKLIFAAERRPLTRIKQRDYVRASTVPAHAVLSSRLAEALGAGPIGWQDMAEGIGR
jgi:dTDP-4-dehydrorhamnose reductase